MKPIELVKALREHVIDDNLQLFEDTLNTTENATDPTWKGILPIYNGLSGSQKKDFLNFLRLVEVGILSHLLGILDGTSSTYEIKDDFILTTVDDNAQLNGDLQDLFLEMEEINRKR